MASKKIVAKKKHTSSKVAKHGRRAGKGKQTCYIGFRTAQEDDITAKKIARIKGVKPSAVFRAALKVGLKKPKSLAEALAAA